MILTDDKPDIMGTNDAFILAAASYFGVPVHQVMPGSHVESAPGTFDVWLRVALTPDDIKGVARRMAAMEDVGDPEPRPDQVHVPYADAEKVDIPAHVYLTAAECTPLQRVMALGQDEKGRYAIALEDLTDEQQLRHAADVMQVLHPVSVEAVEQAVLNGNRKSGDPVPVGLMAAVQANRSKIAEHFGVPAHMLVEGEPPLTSYPATADAMRAGYVERTVAATDRLIGGDGKPTSNADDFGGVPG